MNNNYNYNYTIDDSAFINYYSESEISSLPFHTVYSHSYQTNEFSEPKVKKQRKLVRFNPYVHKNSGALCIHCIGDEDADEYINIMKEFTKIWFFQSFREPIIGLHDNIEELIFGSNIILSYVKFYPSSLKKLILFCDIPVDNLPEGLEVLHLMGDFNQKINNLPNTIKEIIVCSSFRHTIENLPSSLETFEISIMSDYGYLYSNKNKIAEKKNVILDLPNSLKKLKITGYIELPVLPTYLKNLELVCFNDSIEGILPEGLEELTLGELFNQPICNKFKSFLPQNLKKLTIGNNHSNSINFNHEINYLPDSLEELSIYSLEINKICKLPKGLKKFKFHNSFNFPIPMNDGSDVEFVHNFEMLPQTLEEIEIKCHKYKFNKIPENCKKLSLIYSEDLDFFALPPNLEYFKFINIIKKNKEYRGNIQFCKYLNIIEQFVFPETLKFLELSYFDSNKINLNNGLKNLKFKNNGFKLDEIIINDLPDSIEELFIETSVKEINKLPESLKNIWYHYTNRDKIKKLLNQDIKYKETGMLERQYAASNFFSFY